ncbi:MAG: GNAT family N-acetyltransferase [Nitriliruptoraceae bacterium]
MAPRRATDRAELLARYDRDREAHPYGIADLEQLWDVSRWWRRGEGIVGLLELPGSPLPVGYAIAARRPNATLELLADLAARDLLPPRFVITGPPGTAERLAPGYQGRRTSRYLKLALPTSAPPIPPDPEARRLGVDDLPALDRLYATDPSAGDFFHPGLLDTGCYLGIEAAGELVAAAGVHVLDRVNGVAAIGNVVTAPTHRGRGLGRRVTGAVCHRLRPQVATIGLNVAPDNHPARRVYRRLGFTEVLAFEEAELTRGDRGSLACPSPGD